MPVFVCRNCGAVHTEDWFAYEWKKVHDRKTGMYRLVRGRKRKEKPDAVECRVCGRAVYAVSVPTAVEGTFEVADLSPVSEDEHGQLYFLGHDVEDPELPLVAVPVSRRTANAVARKTAEGYAVLKFVAGKSDLLVFGVSTERPSDRLLKARTHGGKDSTRQQHGTEGILAYA